MESTLSPISADGLSCLHCSSPVGIDEIFCSNCGYPQNGSEEQQSKFYRKIDAKARLLKIVEKEVKKAKTTLVILGVLNAIAGIVYGFISEDVLSLAVSSILAIIYFGLAIWSDKEPFSAILTGLIIYGSLILIQAVLEPISIFSGIIWKILIIALLVKGMKSGLEARRVKSELADLGVDK